MTERKLVIELAGAEGLDDWIGRVVKWFETGSFAASGQNIIFRQGQREMYGWRITGLWAESQQTEDDLLEQVPFSCTVHKIGDLWYLTTTHGNPFGEHDHIEVKLDREQLGMLHAEITKRLMEDR